jgi:DNA-binding LytR/AlgR family response regulator
MTATALIAEDEPLLAQALQHELAALWPELEVVAVAPNGIQAQRDLLSLRPDIAFLDVRMPGASGIEVAQAVAEDWPDETHPPLLVFVTAYDQFALDAFGQAAVDYVLKPVQSGRLAQTVQRLKQRLSERASGHGSGQAELAARRAVDELASQLQRLLANPPVGSSGVADATGPGPQRGAAAVETLRVLRAGVGDTVRMIRLDEVIYLQATDKYVNVVTAESELLIREPLRDLMPRLDPGRFVQVHRSTVVNLDYVLAASRDRMGRLSLTLRGRSERVGVSRIYAHLFKAM